MNIELYLVLSQDIKTCFNDNNINLQDIFNREQIEANLEYSSDPSLENESEREKEIIPKVITSSVATVLILTSITSLLAEIYRRPYVFEFYENQELIDSNGNIVFDSQGNPKIKLVKKIELVQPKQADITKELTFNLNLKQGITIKIKESGK